MLRALSALPDAVHDWLALAAAQYLSIAAMVHCVRDPNRAINRLQMELMAVYPP